MDNTKLLVEFLKKNNILEEKGQRILEVLNEPSDSIARYSTTDIYLLNNLVRKKELDRFGIRGEMGTLTENGIVLPKEKIISYRQQNKEIPEVGDFDLILGAGISNTSFVASNFSQEKLFGFCTETTDPNLRLRLTRASSLVEKYNSSKDSGYELLTTEEQGKVYCLVKKIK